MKTKEQILKWLDNQPWKGEFYEAVFTLRADLRLSYNDLFISTAFFWDKTEQGQGVWAEREYEFSKWYDSNDKPLSWEEYCEQNPIKECECYIDDDCSIQYVTTTSLAVDRDANTDANVMSEDLCEAFLAYMKLIQLRNAWVKGRTDNEHRIIYSPTKGFSWVILQNGISFYSSEMADEFIKTFKDLLEVAKPLI